VYGKASSDSHTCELRGEEELVSSSKCLRPMGGNRNQGFFGFLSPLVTGRPRANVP
jgi:hypothetical protein